MQKNLIALLPTPTLPCTQTDLGCIPQDPIQFSGTIYGIGLSMIGGVALLFIIFGGYQILTSRGNYEQVKKGRSSIMYALIGLILAIFGYVLLTVVATDILHIPGFS